MHGLIRSFGRVAVMGAVMVAVLTAALIAGVGTTTAIALGIVVAGAAGLVGVARKPRTQSAFQEIEAMMANDPMRVAARQAAAAAAKPTAVESMAPAASLVNENPEANMPRWRRPSLLEARRSDPTRYAPAPRPPMRFGDQSGDADLRVVRYAVVPVLDRPDEVLGLQVSDVAAGDEVHVVGSSGAFLEIVCPNYDRGWVHRTTLGARGSAGNDPRQSLAPEADDALTALLTARGLI